MRLAIMQPYWFPYLGYYQLIHAVDDFVIYDDVNYIKGGWINRNYVLSQGGKLLMTLGLHGASPNKLINEITVGARREKLLKTIRQCYCKAPEYRNVFPLIEEIMMQQEDNLAKFLGYGLRRICDHLGLSSNWRISSDIKKDNTLRGQDKILAICETLGASHYINPMGGRELYSRDAFASRNIKLSFIHSRPGAYRQLGNPFIPNLSIIDVMMFNDRRQCRTLLEGYECV